MKHILLCFFLCHCCTYIASQNYSEDSALFSQKLEPFRKHLDSMAKNVDPTELLYLFQTTYAPPIDPRDISLDNATKITGKDTDKTTEPKNNRVFIVGSVLSLMPPNYAYNEIITNDTSQALFVEISYALPNRSELLWYKSQFENSNTPSGKIKALLNYIRSANRCYPVQSDFRFSMSNTLLKYYKQLKVLFQSIPQDTIRCDLLIQYAQTLEEVDVSWWRNDIFYLYKDAETILLAPYWKSLEEKKMLSDSASYSAYITKNKFINRLLNVYGGLIKTLSPEFTININNELYVIEQKKKRYVIEYRRILKIAASLDINKREELEDLELSMLMETFTAGDFNRAKSIKYVFADLSSLLIADFNKLLSYPSSDISEKKRFYLYYALGGLFYNLHQYDYALKAFYKSFEVLLITNQIIPPDVFEVSTYLVTSIFKKENLSFDPDEINYDSNNFCFFYELVNENAKYKRTPLLPVSRAFQKINRLRVMYFKGNKDYAKNILINAKRYLLNDTTYSLANDYDLTLIYQELTENGWVEPDKAELAIEKQIDSAVIADYKNPYNVRPRFDGNPNIIQQYSLFERIENESLWKYYAADLKDSIAIAQKSLDKKTALIIAKQNEITRLNGINEVLADSIKSKNEQLDTLAEEINNKNEEIDTLGRRIDSSTSKLTGLTVINGELTRQNANLENIKTWLWRGIALSFVIAGMILFRAYKKVKKLNHEKNNLEAEVAELEIQAKDLRTIIEAEKAIHETELKYENEKVLREYGLKHEIVEVFNHLKRHFNVIVRSAKTKAETITISLDLFKTKLDKLSEFANSYYTALNIKNEYNIIDDEIKLSNDYIEFIKTKRNVTGYYFIDARSVRPKGIILPPHLLNNFVKNAIEKAKIDNKALHIEITDEMKGDAYILTISDDGNGIGENFDINSLQKTSTGIKGIIAQLDYYNSRSDQQYIIQFDNSSFVNRASAENTNGTRVTLRFKPKVI